MIMKNIVKFLFLVLCGTCINLPAYSQEQTKKKVAVYMTGTVDNEAYKKVIGSKLVSAITESGEYVAVERTADFLAALSAESDYQTSGEVRDSQIAQLGQKFGVEYVAVTDISKVFDEFFISSRMINVESALVERAFDTSGPAESMAQLVSLSESVASGLISGMRASQRAKDSTEPVHLALCAIKDNRIVYITASEWEKLSAVEKTKYKKEGVCVLNNGEIMIVSLFDGNNRFDEINHRYLPEVRQIEYLYKIKDQLGPVRSVFGEGFRDTYYWTKRTSDNKKEARAMSMGSGEHLYLYTDIQTYWFNIFTIDDIKNLNPTLCTD